ncbi:ATP-binding region ATPase domain protein [Gemmatirosa kalamazoonensis]|uniref:histidine kinase n=1 Tax=Gemmatirosa kalamazoonensis TaxID=861299 RepID=W0RLG3_9BACT|nr:ATP-binding protein [Gemmatirosa kalamazoonensis]AHG90258.1 ATP-binding region ATPase domain protein [Gemmatirosa kalamazoonensis]
MNLVTRELRAARAAPAWRRVAASAGVWLLALVGTIVLRAYLHRANFAIFWIAVLYAAWYAGFRAALGAALLSLIAVEYVLSPPVFEFAVPALSSVVTFAIFVGASGLVSALAASLARSQRLSDEQTLQLQEQAAELEAQMEEAQVMSEELGATNTSLERALREADDARSAEQIAADRARRLLAVTSGLSRAMTVEEVADVIFREGLSAAGADAGSLALVRHARSAANDADLHDAWLEVVRTHGYAAPIVDAFRRFPLRAGRPLSDALLTGAPVLLASRDEWRARYAERLVNLDELGYEALATIPITSGGRTLGAVSASFRQRVAFDEGTRTFLATLGEQCGLALARALAYEAERRAREASQFISEASRVLSASLEYETTLRAVAAAAVPVLGDWCAVDVVRDPTRGDWPPDLERVAIVHRDPEKMALGLELMRRYPTDWSQAEGIPRVLRERVPLFIPVVTDELLAGGARDAEQLRLMRALQFASIIVVPLVARDVTLGALTLCMTQSGRRYDDADLALAQDLAQRAAVAVDNARLYRDAERARAEAEAASLAKTQFLSTMSHELRTPLNAILGYAELLEMGVRGPVSPAQLDDLARVRRSATVLMSLVNDVLNFARIEAGQVEFDIEPVRVDQALADLETLVAPQLQQKAIRYEYRPCGDAPRVRADADRLKQIMTNLLTNALKFTDEGGRITVSCDATDDAVVRVRVADSGRGIPRDRLVDIFEPFVQVDRHLTHASQQGVGLGLAISRDLARAMDGDLTVESSIGEGSTFTLSLPRADGRPA